MILNWNKKALSGSVDLPASKSICNRVLIIRALTANPFLIENISTAEDSQNLHNNLERFRQDKKSQLTLDVGPAGTNMRFLTAFLATKPGLYILKGTERMHQRPLKPLVNALKQLGAEIEYLEKEGYPPLRIHGKELTGGKVRLPADVSSQFVSALMMIGPHLGKGLVIKLEGDPVSYSYIHMTAGIMKQCGADVNLHGTEVKIAPVPYYRENSFAVESDWSAASYWYGMLALAGEGGISLPGLGKESLQGDSILGEWMEPFGIRTVFNEEGACLTKVKSEPFAFSKDFTLAPDLAQTFITLLAAKGYEGKLTGLKTLRIKETDRLKAMKAELLKCGIVLDISTGSASLKPQKLKKPTVPVQTYHDHRMAMAFAMLALKTGTIEIQHPEVVGKSYPTFWKELEKAGMELEEE